VTSAQLACAFESGPFCHRPEADALAPTSRRAAPCRDWDSSRPGWSAGASIWALAPLVRNRSVRREAAADQKSVSRDRAPEPGFARHHGRSCYRQCFVSQRDEASMAVLRMRCHDRVASCGNRLRARLSNNRDRGGAHRPAAPRTSSTRSRRDPRLRRNRLGESDWRRTRSTRAVSVAGRSSKASSPSCPRRAASAFRRLPLAASTPRNDLVNLRRQAAAYAAS